MVAGSAHHVSRRGRSSLLPEASVRRTRIDAMLREVALRFDGTNEHDVAAWFADAYGISAHERRTWRRQSRFRATRAHHAGTDARPAWRGKQGSDGAAAERGPREHLERHDDDAASASEAGTRELHVGFESRPATREGRLPQRWR